MKTFLTLLAAFALSSCAGVYVTTDAKGATIETPYGSFKPIIPVTPTK